MPHLIDIEVPEGSTLILLRRDDGSMTVSVEHKAVIAALRCAESTQREFQPVPHRGLN